MQTYGLFLTIKLTLKDVFFSFNFKVKYLFQQYILYIVVFHWDTNSYVTTEN